MIIGFDHTSFTVEDVDRAVRFWTESLGFERSEIVIREGDWPERVTGVGGAKLKIAHVFGYGQHVEFVEYLEPVTKSEAVALSPNVIGVAHVALVVDDVMRTSDTLLQAGAKWQGQPADVVVDSVLKGRAAYIRDPNGIIIELWEPVAHCNEIEN